MKRNETLTQTLLRLEGDLELLERNHAAEEDKQRKLRENLVQVATMVELTQRDLNAVLAVSAVLSIVIWQGLLYGIKPYNKLVYFKYATTVFFTKRQEIILLFGIKNKYLISELFGKKVLFGYSIVKNGDSSTVFATAHVAA